MNREERIKRLHDRLRNRTPEEREAAKQRAIHFKDFDAANRDAADEQDRRWEESLRKAPKERKRQ